MPEGSICNFKGSSTSRGDGICIQDECRQIGCDNVLDSNKKENKCGVCDSGKHWNLILLQCILRDIWSFMWFHYRLFILIWGSSECVPIISYLNSSTLYDYVNATSYKNVSTGQFISPKYHQIATIPRGSRHLVVAKDCQHRDGNGNILRYHVSNSVWLLVMRIFYLLWRNTPIHKCFWT